MIPTYQECMKPLLQTVKARPCDLRTLEASLSERFALTDEEMKQRHQEGKGKLVYVDRISWARTYLHHAKLIELPYPGITLITERGKEALAQKKPINTEYLKQFPEFLDWYEDKQPEEEKKPRTFWGALKERLFK